MTIDEIATFLYDQSQEQTLTRQDVDRCVCLIYEMGKADGKAERFLPRRNPFDHTNTWLAEQGYGTWRMVLNRCAIPDSLKLYTLPESLEEAGPDITHAWLAATAAIRRRVVTHRLPAEETDAES